MCKRLSEGHSIESLKGWLSTLPEDDIIEIWDGCRRLRFYQGTIQSDHNDLVAKKRNARTNGNIRISANQAYKDDITNWVVSIQDFNIEECEMALRIYHKPTVTEIQQVEAPAAPGGVPITNEVLLASIRDSESRLMTKLNNFENELAAIKQDAETNKNLLQNQINMNTDRFNNADRELRKFMREVESDKDIFAERLTGLENQDIPNQETINDYVRGIVQDLLVQANVNNNNPNDNPARIQNNAIWGGAVDNLAHMKIPRRFTYAVSRIPNQAKYSTDWLYAALERSFNVVGTNCTIDSVERIPASHEGARTKTFKVILLPGDDVTADTLKNPNLWIQGTRVARYSRPRVNRNVGGGRREEPVVAMADG